MNEFFVRLLDDVNSRIQSVNGNILSGSQIIQILCEALEQLRAYVRENGFVSMEEEINFFKIFKPQLCSQFIYYFEVRSIQSRFPCYSSREMVELFYRGEIKRIDRYFIDNLYLQQYMELGVENPLKVVPLIHSNLTPVKFSHSPFCLFLFSSYSSCPLCRVLH